MVKSRNDLPALFNDIHRELNSNPMVSFDSIFDKIFKQNFPGIKSTPINDIITKSSYPKVNIKDRPTKIEIIAAVPGLKKEDIDITIDDDILCISASSQTTKYDEADYVQRELHKSSFKRSWKLSDNLNKEDITAHSEDGLLYITIPKKDEDIKTKRKIEIG